MRYVDNEWKKHNASELDDLLESMMNNYYDKHIYVLPCDKDGWFKLTEQEQHHLKFKYPMDRKHALHWLSVRQKECAYQITKI